MDFSPKDSLAITKAKMDGSIVEKTLDTLNSGQFYSGKSKKNKAGGQQAMSETYDFQKKVLGAVYSDKGAIANRKS